MAKHRMPPDSPRTLLTRLLADPDLIFCRKQPCIAIGRLCEKCDGKCVICDSYVRPCTLVRICDECNYGTYQVLPHRLPGRGPGPWMR